MTDDGADCKSELSGGGQSCEAIDEFVGLTLRGNQATLRGHGREDFWIFWER